MFFFHTKQKLDILLNMKDR